MLCLLLNMFLSPLAEEKQYCHKQTTYLFDMYLYLYGIYVYVFCCIYCVLMAYILMYFDEEKSLKTLYH